MKRNTSKEMKDQAEKETQAFIEQPGAETTLSITGDKIVFKAGAKGLTFTNATNIAKSMKEFDTDASEDFIAIALAILLGTTNGNQITEDYMLDLPLNDYNELKVFAFSPMEYDGPQPVYNPESKRYEITLPLTGKQFSVRRLSGRDGITISKRHKENPTMNQNNIAMTVAGRLDGEDIIPEGLDDLPLVDYAAALLAFTQAVDPSSPTLEVVS